ncbi:MAG TPA: translation initiation factor IF-2 N-terminal domain-containing protein, partial [Terracidiphilus sp.]
MSKVRINDLARELEVKSRQVLDLLTELSLGDPKMTHSSSIEDHEADKVRAHFGGARSASSTRTSQSQQQPKIDLSHISKPGDAVKAILARKQAQEEAARRPVAVPPKPAVVAVQAPAAPAKPAVPAASTATPAPKPEPRKIVPAPRQAPNIVTPPS